MNFISKTIDTPLKQATQCAVVFYTGKKLSSTASAFDEALGGLLSRTLELGDLSEKIGAHQWLPCDKSVSAKRILLISAGKLPQSPDKKDFYSLINSLATRLNNAQIKDAIVFCDEIPGEEVDWFCTNLGKQCEKASYKYTETKSEKDNSKNVSLSKITVALASKEAVKTAKNALQVGQAMGVGINLTRELGNLPPNICTPSYLADLANDLAKSSPALSAKALSEKQMEKLGMGAFLSVSKGSDEEGKMIIMEYRGADKASDKSKKLQNVPVIVGKGITFDTGGISLKPGASMDEMKFDMCGAASVFGVIKTLVEMNAKINVVGVVAAAENMPSGRASKPGDVVTSMSGQTIEILNTDAEGRLVLCDALTYVERYKPSSVIDIATLTGACVIALGSHASGLYANQQELADKLLASGQNAQDKAWQMPLWDEYQKQLDSNFADMANIGGRPAGSVTAACFLSRYTKAYPWAHIDIAGTAWKSGGAKGATGRSVALLVDYLLNNSK